MKKTESVIIGALAIVTFSLIIIILSRDMNLPAHFLKQQNRIPDEDSKTDEWEEILSFAKPNVTKCNELTASLQTSFPPSFLLAVQGYDAIVNLTRMEGHSGSFVEEQMIYWQIAKASFVRTVCETGFNAGHSALLWLNANSQVHVYSFDVGTHEYSRRMAAYLNNLYPRRLTVTWGDSTKTLREFHASNPDIKCYIVVVDGGHSEAVATSDIDNFKPMATKAHIFVIDDHPLRNAGHLPGVRDAYEKQKKRGDITEKFRCTTGHRGLTVGRYSLSLVKK